MREPVATESLDALAAEEAALARALDQARREAEAEVEAARRRAEEIAAGARRRLELEVAAVARDAAEAEDLEGERWRLELDRDRAALERRAEARAPAVLAWLLARVAGEAP